MIAIQSHLSNEYQSGSRINLLLIHGFPFSSSMWNAVIEPLSKANLNLYTVDMPGFGKAPVKEAWNMEEASAAIYDALKREGIDHAVIGGLSMGGYIAFSFYRRYPDVVRALILSDTKAAADTPDAKKDREVFAQDTVARGPVAIMERMYPKLTSEKTQRERADVQSQIKQWIEATNSQAAAAALRAM